jgi:hypothetical protein
MSNAFSRAPLSTMINSHGDIIKYYDVNHPFHFLKNENLCINTRFSYRYFMSEAVLLICTIVGMRQKVVQITTPVNVFKRLVFLEKDKV